MGDVNETLNNQADRINSLIKEFVELNEVIHKCRKSRYYWELHFSALSMNIWTGQVKYLQLQKKEANLRTAFSEAAKMIEFKEQEVKSLTTKRVLYFSNQCDQFRERGTKYAEYFLRAQKEYSPESLSKDIAEFQQKHNKVNNELPILRKQLANLETLYGLNNLYSQKENEEILKINIVLTSVTENNNKKLPQITSMQNMLKKLENEIKQKKITLNTFQNK